MESERRLRNALIMSLLIKTDFTSSALPPPFALKRYAEPDRGPHLSHLSHPFHLSFISLLFFILFISQSLFLSCFF